MFTEFPAPGEAKNIDTKAIAAHCDKFKGADNRRSLIQLVSTLALFAATCGLMFYSLPVSYWLTLLLALPAAGLLMRLFIFQHDCGHGSFFTAKKLNDWTGRCLGVLTFTPYDFWRRAHNMHHATSGNLDKRSIGGIDTITVREYKALPKWRRRAYRIYRHPLVLLLLGTPFYVMVVQRLPIKQSTPFHDNYRAPAPQSTRASIMGTNAAIGIVFGGAGALVGFGPLLAVYLPVLVITTWVGGWLFYIQHQFEETYWSNAEEWTMQDAALHGSSYYQLPKVLQWFTGNIGLHHIHHLCSKIPNYKLQECMDARPALKDINRLSLKDSLACIPLKLWDEKRQRLVNFAQIEK